MTTMPKQIKGGQGVGIPDVRKPRCPDHQREMQYYPEQGIWRCPEQRCTKVGVPKDDSGGTHKRQVLGTGKLTLVIQDGKLWIRSENNVMLDIDSVMTNFVPYNGLGVAIVELSFSERIELQSQ